jgi:H+/Cl- antiporter ClcA
MYHWLGRAVEGGNNLVVDAVHEPAAGLPPRIVPLIFIGTVATHVAGGSAGREGTAVQMGGGIASALASLYRLGADDRRTLLMAGISAGFGAVFGTPIAGAIFALEVLTIGRINYRALVPVLIAGLLADWTTAAWGIHHTAYHVTLAPRAIDDLPFDWLLMAKVIVAGVVFGLASLLFTELTHGVGRFSRRVIGNPILRPAVAGVAVIALVYVAGTRDYLGLGVSSASPGATTIVSSFRPGGADDWAWILKIVFTAVTIGGGFKGGEVTPLFFIGATLGNRLGGLLHAPIDLFAGLGFAGVFAGAANTPLACTVMGIELFGAGPAVYLAVACFTAYLVSGHTGIYLAQRVGVGKAGNGKVEGFQLRHLRDHGRRGS